MQAVVEDAIAIGQVEFSVRINSQQNGAEIRTRFELRLGHLDRGNQRTLVTDINIGCWRVIAQGPVDVEANGNAVAEAVFTAVRDGG